MHSDQVRRKLDDLITVHGYDYAAISKYLGRNAAYIQQFIKRGVPRRLKEADRKKLAHFFDIPEKELGGYDKVEKAAIDLPEIYNADGDKLSDDFVFIPYFDIRASAGAGSFIEREDAKASLAFRREWVSRVASGSPHDLAVLLVEGDSMEPTLAHGDLILVDRSQAHSMRDGIYVLRTDDALLVKRISVNPSTQKINIKSDNSAYESWPDCSPEHIDLIGRVIWVGRRL